MLDKTKTNPRDELRTAVHKRNSTAKSTLQTETALDAAKATLKEVQEHLAKYQGIDQLLAEHRAAIEKSWASRGGTGTREHIPPDITEKVRERDQCQEDVNAAQRAVELISNDLAQCRAVLHKWSRRADLEAAKIVAEHSTRIAANLREAQQRVWTLTNEIRGLSRCWTANPIDPDGQLGPISLPREVISSLDRPEPAYVPANNPETLAAAKFRAWHLGLQSNPDLKFEDVVLSNGKGSNK
jgi:hypothetical protein